MRRLSAVFFASLLVLAACSSSDGTSAPSTTTASTTTPSTTVPSTTTPSTTLPDTTLPSTTGATPTSTGTPDPERPYSVFVPSSYDAATPMPLVILLHGFTASGDIQEGYFQLEPLAEARGFLYVHPDGTIGALGNRFWNATPACCDFLRSGVDDVAYLNGIIDQVSATYNVDPKRIFFAGHSNGGFMSYRMACEHADRVAAIASLAGATFDDTTACSPSEPVSVMEVHGTADQTIEYGGGQYFGGTYPSAPQTVATWAGYDGCATTPTPTERTADIDKSIPGDETTIEVFVGCPQGVDVELWTVPGGPHIPPIVGDDGTRTLSEAMIDFLFAHPKP